MIKSENVTFTYPAFDETDCPTPVLNGIDLTIATGDFVAILGHNGSGKSTFARHINALLTPTGGTLWVNGKDTSDPQNLWDIRRGTGMLFQNPDNQIVATTVEEDVAFGPENLGVDPQEIRTRVDAALAAVNMCGYETTPPHHLSGGQKQRVAIAGVLAMQPNCIVLDEPTAMLDPAGRKEVLDTVMRLNRETGMTVILITHFMEEAAKANRIIVLEAGKVAMDGTPREVFARVPEMKALGVGVPQITELAYELRKHGLPFDGTVLTVREFLQMVKIHDMFPDEDTHKPQAGTQISADTGALFSPVSADICVLTNPALELQNLTHIYSPGTTFEKHAISDVSLAISKGEMVAIIGHTGSGKSTLIQHLNALLKPTSGQVLLGGEDIHADKTKLKSIRQRVGLVFQYPEHQLFESTVYRDVAFGPTRMNLSAAEIAERTRHALSAVGIPQALFEKSPFELSGGQKRRVAIAGVLAMRPEILILDEPAAGLDPAGKDEILAQIKHMHTTLGITVFLVSHSMDDTARLCNRIFVMSGGKLATQGIPSEVFAQTGMLKSIGLDTPQIAQVFAELHKTNPNIPPGVFDLQNAVTLLQQFAAKGRSSCHVS